MGESPTIRKDEVLNSIDGKQWFERNEFLDLQKIEASNFDLKEGLTPKERKEFWEKLNTEVVFAYGYSLKDDLGTTLEKGNLDPKILEDRPDSSELYVLYSKLCDKLGEKPMSVEYLVHSGASMRIMSDGKTDEGEIKEGYEKNFDVAINIQEELVQKEPDNPKALGTLGNLYVERGFMSLQKNPDLAQKDFQTSLRYFNSPQLQGEAHIMGNKGLAYLALGDKNKALETYQKALKFNPHDEIISYNATKLCLEKGDGIGALTILENFEKDPMKKAKITETRMNFEKQKGGNNFLQNANQIASNTTSLDVMTNNKIGTIIGERGITRSDTQDNDKIVGQLTEKSFNTGNLNLAILNGKKYATPFPIEVATFGTEEEQTGTGGTKKT